ncbi:hypothetical protein [Siminovitchia sp. 179-K 8D1 HS]|uniref:hypothetical protein n=1 Tax=Siminovitchia sp. 179-K 8D1 HS TaxID=3142385 RepID=UPI0039A1967C
MKPKTIKDEIVDFESNLQKVRDFLVELPKLRNHLKEELKLLEDERQDLLHYAELGRFNACEGFKIAKDIQEVQLKRRDVKDLLELVQLTCNKIEGKYNTNLLNEALGEIRKASNYRRNRTYRTRIREDLKDKINTGNKNRLTKTT